MEINVVFYQLCYKKGTFILRYEIKNKMLKIWSWINKYLPYHNEYNAIVSNKSCSFDRFQNIIRFVFSLVFMFSISSKTSGVVALPCTQ